MRKLITTDSHLAPPPWLVMELPEKMRERAQPGAVVSPGFVKLDERDGKHYLNYPAGLSTMGGVNKPVETDIEYDDEEALLQLLRESGQESGITAEHEFTPVGRLRDMEREGVVGAVLLGDALIRISREQEDIDAQIAFCQIVNDWLGDTYKDHLGLFAPAIHLPYLDPAACATELERGAAKGLRPGMLPDGIADDPYSEPHWEPLWEAANALHVPIAMHTGGTSIVFHDGRPVGNPVTALQNAVNTFAKSGILMRYPDLHVVMTEGGIHWLAAIVMQGGMPGHEERQNMMMNIRGDLSPDLEEHLSFYIKRQVHATFMWDPVGINNRHFTGLDSLMWGNDYPHPEGTFPDSQFIVEEQFQGVPEEEIEQITYSNAKRVYRLVDA